MLVKEIIAVLNPIEINNVEREAQITGICNNGSAVSPGAVFFAIEGTKHDGHDFAEMAVKRGAALVVGKNKKKLAGVPSLLVADARKSLSRAAAFYYNEPSRGMSVVGITGTNGKTTTNWILYHLLLMLDGRAARLGTLGFEAASNGALEAGSGELTTPDPIAIHSDLAQAVKLGAKYCVMEASSHSLDQSRIDDIHFDVAIYTNLTRDHLDYHGDMESYFKAKARIFHILKGGSKSLKTAILNLDCEYGSRMMEVAKWLGLRTVTFGTSSRAEFLISDFNQNINGSSFVLSGSGLRLELHTPFIGSHNAENACGAVLACLKLGFTPSQVAEAMSRVPQVPGRLESVGTKEISVFVDYAHTPDALTNVLKALKPLVSRKLWVVFGCGGDRDKGKRPQMAAAARQFADHLVVTSDNPRTEDPAAIIGDILASGVKVELCEIDRREAIKKAVQSAEPGDVVLVAGKGHEDYQIIGEERFHFSDVEEARKSLHIETS